MFSNNMDEFAEDVRTISKILNVWDYGFFVAALRRYANEPTVHKRLQLVLQDYFLEKDSIVVEKSLVDDAKVIKGIFPECSDAEIYNFLEEVGNEDNRIRLVARRLLKRNSALLKRTHSSDVVSDEIAKKKPKIGLAMDDIIIRPSTSTFNTVDSSAAGKASGSGTFKKPSTITAETITSNQNPPVSMQATYTKCQSTITAATATTTSTNPPVRTQDNYASTSTEATKPETSSGSFENGQGSLPIIEAEGEEKPTSSLDSQSTIPYSLNSETTDIKEVTLADQDILMSLLELIPTPNSDDASNDVTSTENLTTNVATAKVPIANTNDEVVSNGMSYVSKVVNDDPMVLKIAKVCELRDLPSSSGVVENVPIVTTLSRRLATNEDSSSGFLNNIRSEFLNIVGKSYQPTTFNTININVHDNGASTHKPLVNIEENGNYHLYKHLMEMFTNIPKKYIKLVCHSYGVNKHEKPGDKLFSAIVSDLLTLPSSSISPKKDIIIPDSPDSPSPERPTKAGFTSPPADFITEEWAKNPFFTGGLIHNTPVRNLLPPATALATPPRPDRLGDILEDLIETVSDHEEEELLGAGINNEAEPIAVDETEEKRLIFPLMEMFPEACPQYIRQICKGKQNVPGVLDNLISQILDGEYPKRVKSHSPVQQMEAEEQFKMLKDILPDADPTYLQSNFERFIDNPDELKVFIANALENRSYPKLKDALRNQQISAQQKQYTTEFKVENFVEVIPEPTAYFEDPKRKDLILNYECQNYVISFLRNHFNKITMKMIRDSFRMNNMNFIRTFRDLEKLGPNMHMRTKRIETPMPTAIQNIPLLQEIAYLEHNKEIKEYIRLEKVKEQEERAAAVGFMQTCSCCFDEEVMPKHIYTCEAGCIFCKECVQRGAEVSFGDGKLDFACLNNCPSHFSLQTLQAVLKPKLFSNIATKKQLEEVKAAGIEDLEMCPFCDFATIPAREDKLFRCLNPECMKESCRLCKEPSHVPLRCDEVEKEDDVKKRTYIENKMTEALVRTCYKCNKKFIKADGCNKMTCSCGALMCYVCGQPVLNYTHFNGNGGDRFDLCPLYSDTNKLHQDAVLKGAEDAKKEIGVDAASTQLKYDPTTDIEKHYAEIAKKHPAHPAIPYVNPFGNELLAGLPVPGLRRRDHLVQQAQQIRNQNHARHLAEQHRIRELERARIRQQQRELQQLQRQHHHH